MQNPLCGLVYCAKCGKKMKRRPYSKLNKQPTLYCDNLNCNNISTKLYILEEQIIYGLKKWLSNYKFKYKEYIEEINLIKLERIKETISSLEMELKKENDKLLNVFNFLEEGTYTKEIFKQRRDILLNNIEKLNISIKEYKIKLKDEEIAENKKEILLPKIENIIDIYNLLETPEEKNELLKLILNKVTYLKTEKAIKKDSDPTNFIITLYPKIENINQI